MKEGTSYRIFSKILILGIFLLASNLLFAGEGDDDALGIIKGKVLTADNKPAEAVSVQIKGTKRITTTNENGVFEFRRLQAGEYTLQVSLVGFETVEETATVTPGKTTQVSINLSVTDKNLQEVIVTGGQNKFAKKESNLVARMPLKNLENPQVYNVISKDLLKEQVVVNFDDAIKNSPGVNRLWSSTGRPNDGAGYFSMRGFSVQPTMINGVPGLTNGGVDPANIERIETIKGPSGTLFGSSLIAFGGLINIVTKKPYETFGGEVTYTAGGFGLSRVTADINAPLDQNKSALLRVNAAYHNEGSFQDAGFKKSMFLAPSFAYKVNDKLSFLINTEFYTSEATNTLMVFLNRSRPLIARTPKELNMDFNRSYTSNDISYKNPTVNLFGQMTYKLSDKWTSQTNLSRSVRKSDGYYSYVMFLDANPYYPMPLPPNDTLITRYVYYQNSVTTTTDLQQNFIGDFHIGKFRNRIVAGIDVMNIQSVSNNSPYAVFDYVNVTRANDPRYGQLTRSAVDAKLAATSGATKNGTNTYTYSVYVSDVFNITKQLMAMASLRLDYFDTKPSIDYNTSIKSGKYDQKSLAPKFGLVYQIVDDKVSLFANYMNGFKNLPPVSTNAAAGYPVNLKPQQADQKEGGVKLDLFNHKLAVTASYYDIEVTNTTMSISVQDPNYPSDPNKKLNATVQDGSQKSKGVEFDLIASPVNGLNIIAGYGYNDSKVVNTSSNTLGKRPTTAGPANLANLWVSYTFKTGKLQGFGAGFGGNYASENKITSTSTTGDFTLPAYTVVNATLFYNADKFRIAVKGDNLADKEYFGGWTTVEKQMPRRFSASFAFKF